MFVCIYMCMCVCMYVYIYIYIYICIYNLYTYTCVCMCVCVCMYAYVCIYVYVCMCISLVIKEIGACTTITHANLWNYFAPARNNHSIHLKGSKFAIAFFWLANDLSCYVFSKNVNGNPKLLVFRVPLKCSSSFSSAYVTMWWVYFYIQMRL